MCVNHRLQTEGNRSGADTPEGPATRNLKPATGFKTGPEDRPKASLKASGSFVPISDGAHLSFFSVTKGPERQLCACCQKSGA
jgi:hypothetical protein